MVKDHSVTSLYRDPVFTPDALNKVEEFVGGRFVKEVYHTEDINMTLDDIGADADKTDDMTDSSCGLSLSDTQSSGSSSASASTWFDTQSSASVGATVDVGESTVLPVHGIFSSTHAALCAASRTVVCL